MGGDWGRLGDAIVARRVRMGIKTREKFAGHSGLSLRTLSDLELGNRTSYDPSTLSRLEVALEWAPGSVDAVLEGGQPTTTAEALLRARQHAQQLDPLVAKLAWALDPASPLHEGDRDWLREAVGLIVDRAVNRYGPDGGVAQQRDGGG